MATDAIGALETWWESHWTCMAMFSIKRHPSLLSHLGCQFTTSQQVVPPTWSHVTKLAFRDSSGWEPTTLTVEDFQAIAERHRQASADLFDLRPGWARPFREWLEVMTVCGCPFVNVDHLIGDWPDYDMADLGPETRICLWYTS